MWHYKALSMDVYVWTSNSYWFFYNDAIVLLLGP